MGRAEVEIRNVTKRFGGVVAVNNVAMRIEPGEFFSILGPSGCGKTTLLRMMAGFEFPDDGEIVIGGRVMGNTPAYARPTNMVFQQLALFPHMNVFNNVAFGLRMARVPRVEIARRVMAILDMVQMTGYEARRIHQLSGGQQQRIAIARALVNEPMVLFLDEPLGALDLKLRLQLQVELKRLQERTGAMFVYVTHDQGEAMTMSDRVAVMKDGDILQIGKPEDIYEKPTTRFVATFIGDTNLLEATVMQKNRDQVVAAIGDVALTLPVDGRHLNPGDPVHFSLRPERIEVGPVAEDLDYSLSGTVANSMFVGSFIRYRIEVGTDMKLMVEVSTGSGSNRYQPGSIVSIGWRAGDLLLLQD